MTEKEIISFPFPADRAAQIGACIQKVPLYALFALAFQILVQPAQRAPLRASVAIYGLSVIVLPIWAAPALLFLPVEDLPT